MLRGRRNDEVKGTNKLRDRQDYNRGDAGIQVGTGVWFYDFNVDFTFRHGFVNMISGKDGLS
ncbi:MAG: hypothetical protein IJL35_13175, partial [Bacteroidaceae bacterium]|nr:hypothetical protein [Bacteroidaceae bacterium]